MRFRRTSVVMASGVFSAGNLERPNVLLDRLVAPLLAMTSTRSHQALVEKTTGH
jgi:hypothetical protein